MSERHHTPLACRAPSQIFRKISWSFHELAEQPRVHTFRSPQNVRGPSAWTDFAQTGKAAIVGPEIRMAALGPEMKCHCTFRWIEKNISTILQIYPPFFDWLLTRFLYQFLGADSRGHASHRLKPALAESGLAVTGQEPFGQLKLLLQAGKTPFERQH